MIGESTTLAFPLHAFSCSDLSPKCTLTSSPVGGRAPSPVMIAPEVIALKCAPGIGPPEGRRYGTATMTAERDPADEIPALGSRSVRHRSRKRQPVRVRWGEGQTHRSGVGPASLVRAGHSRTCCGMHEFARCVTVDGRRTRSDLCSGGITVDFAQRMRRCVGRMALALEPFRAILRQLCLSSWLVQSGPRLRPALPAPAAPIAPGGRRRGGRR